MEAWHLKKSLQEHWSKGLCQKNIKQYQSFSGMESALENPAPLLKLGLAPKQVLS